MKRIFFYGQVLLGLLVLCQTAIAVEVPDDPQQVRPLLPGMMMPKMVVHTAAGEEVEINPEKLEKPVVLTFFRGGWCPYCNKYLSSMRHTEKALKDMGFDVWFISPDKPEMLVDSLDEPDIGYTLFSDSSMQVAQDMGVAFRLGDGTNLKYRAFGINIEKASGYDHHYLPVPATFLISENGVIQFQFANADYKVRLPPSVLLAAAKAYRAEEFGKLKPAKK